MSLLLESFNELHLKQKRKFVMALFLQALVAFMDIAAILILGGVAVLAASSVTGESSFGFLGNLLVYFGMNEWELSNQILALTVTATLLFIARSLGSLVLTRKVLLFLSIYQRELGNETFERILKAPFSFMRNRNPQSIANSVIFGLSAFSINALGQIFILMSELIVVTILFLLILIVNIKLASILVIFFLGVLFLMNHWLGKIVSISNAEQYKYRAHAEQIIEDIVRIFREIKVSKRSKVYLDDFNGAIARQSQAYAKDLWVQGLPKYILEFALLSGLLVLLLVGKYSGDFNQVIPTMTVFIGATSRIFPSLLRIQNALFNLRSHEYFATAFQDLRFSTNEAINLEIQRKEMNFTDSILPENTLVVLENASYGFPDANGLFLDNLNLRIDRGERIALVGASGSGKSTISDLILELLQPSSGRVLSSINTTTSQVEVAYLPQETVLIPGTLLENICLGVESHNVDLVTLEDLIKTCQLTPLIAKMPIGIHTPIGADGLMLSGGEKQRVGLARALYSKPKIIVLDEPTSALDAKTEQEILNLIVSIDLEVTIILISHKLQHLVHFPRIIFLDNGKILADGNFAEVRNQITEFSNLLRIAGL
jgi:ABC-type multidrug transport system fused ATPase/permease subunit